MEFLMFCRVCLKEADIMQSIFTPDSINDKNMMIYEKIMQCSSVKINREVNLPDNICSTCLKELQISFKFRSKVEKSDEILNSFIASTNTYKLYSNEIIINNYETYEIKTENDSENNEYIEYNEDFEEIGENIGIDEEFLETKSLENDIRQISTNSCKSPRSINEEYEELLTEYKYNSVADTESLIDDIKRPINNYISMNLNNTNQQEDLKICKRRYNKKSNIQQINKSSAEKHSCEICGNKYKYNHSLQTHLRRHRNERPFPCELCGKAFVLNVELKTHMRTHTGLKPYACRYCERRFSDFGSRVKHERTHTGERPYVCKVCGKAFAYSYGLSGHMLIHTGEKPFGCEKCGKHFNKKHHLKNHLQTHLKNDGKITNNLNQGNGKNIQKEQQQNIKNNKLKIYTIPNSDIIEEIITEELSEDENDDLQYYVLQHDAIDDNILNINNS